MYMDFHLVREWKLSRQGESPTIVQVFFNEKQELYYLEFKILASSNIEVPINLAPIELEPKLIYGLEFGIDWRLLNDNEKIKIYCKIIKHLITIAIWLGYPDIISSVNDTSLTFLKSIQRGINGPNIFLEEKFYDKEFYYILNHNDYSDEPLFIENTPNLTPYTGFLRRGKERVVSLERTVKFLHPDGGFPTNKKIVDAAKYPEVIIQEKNRIKKIQAEDSNKIIKEIVTSIKI